MSNTSSFVIYFVLAVLRGVAQSKWKKKLKKRAIFSLVIFGLSYSDMFHPNTFGICMAISGNLSLSDSC